jgi:hypothetical protein
VNYNNDKAIQIARPEVGIKCLVSYLHEGYNLILLCGCRDYEQCHRHVIVDLLRVALPEVIIHPEDECPPDTMRCLSIQHPWAYLISSGQKDIENREWTTCYRGPLLIHAGAKVDPTWFYRDGRVAEQMIAHYGVREMPATRAEYPLKAIIGMADLIDVVTESESRWFCGSYGFVLRNARAFKEPVPYRGQLGLFPVPLTAVEGALSESHPNAK